MNADQDFTPSRPYPSKYYSTVMTWLSMLAAGCSLGNCFLRVYLCVITVRSVSFVIS